MRLQAIYWRRLLISFSTTNLPTQMLKLLFEFEKTIIYILQHVIYNNFACKMAGYAARSQQPVRFCTWCVWQFLHLWPAAVASTNPAPAGVFAAALNLTFLITLSHGSIASQLVPCFPDYIVYFVSRERISYVVTNNLDIRKVTILTYQPPSAIGLLL
jgi:hypothetical protein